MTAAADKAMEETITASHSVPGMEPCLEPRIGCSVKVGQLTEESETVVDFVAGELLQALGAEALNGE